MNSKNSAPPTPSSSSADSEGFVGLGLSPALLQVLQQLGFENPTPVQTKSIPLLLKGRDLIGQAKTGSGKTAAFTLPLLERISIERREIQGLILCPTRELCTQVAREVRKLGRNHSGLQVAILSGGQPMPPQLHALEAGPQIAVGTPGRVLDHLNRRSLDLRRLSTVVLDEADRMLDMGFQDDMERILSATPERRQTVLFSATFPGAIEKISRTYQHNAARVTIEDGRESSSSIRQQFYQVTPEEKFPALLWLLRQLQPRSAIVFCNQKATVAELARALRESGVNAEAIQGDLEQRDRDRVMAKFRNLSTQILVATDVAARGIDVADLDLVFNYDLPPQPDTYVHRIGRTGRAGKAGHAVSFGSSRDIPRIEAIEASLKTQIARRTVASKEQLQVESQKKILEEEAPMQTLMIAGGRKEKMRPGDILGALTGEAGGLPGSDVGKIEIHDHFSYVAVSKKVAHLALERLKNGRIKGRKFRVEKVR